MRVYAQRQTAVTEHWKNKPLLLFVVNPLPMSVVTTGVTQTKSRYRTNVGAMLDQRRRRWANIAPALIQCLVFDPARPTNVLRKKSLQRITL